MIFNNINSIVNKNRKLKKYLKIVYGLTGNFISKILCPNPIKTKFKFEKQSTEETFFGYYDKPPISPNGKFLISHKIPNNGLNRHEIFITDLTTGKNRVLSTTHAKNFQIGSRLQWLSDREFIFNSFDKANPVCIRMDIAKDTKKIYPSHFFDCFRDKYAVSLNFSILKKHQPEYGYNHIGSGRNYISKIDLKTSTIEYLLDIKDIFNNLNIPTNLPETEFFPNHIMISPDGEGFVFILRYIDNFKREDYLVYFDLKNKEYSFLRGSNFVSHMAWMPKEKAMIGFLKHKDVLGLHKIQLHKGLSNCKVELITKHIRDGHPTVINKNLIALDTYPSFFRRKKLYILNLNSRKIKELARIYEPFTKDLSKRCDLHPRYSNGKIYFDSNHTGKRGLYSIKIDL